VKLYPYTLGFYQFESIIILIDIVLLSCTYHSILQNCDMYILVFAFQKKLKCMLKHMILQYYGTSQFF